MLHFSELLIRIAPPKNKIVRTRAIATNLFLLLFFIINLLHCHPHLVGISPQSIQIPPLTLDIQPQAAAADAANLTTQVVGIQIVAIETDVGPYFKILFTSFLLKNKRTPYQ